MFIIFLKFTDKKAGAPAFMEAHKNWISEGFDDGIFKLVGSLEGGTGGAIFAHGCSLDAVKTRIDQDPFVIEGIVKAEILEIAPGRVSDDLAFLKS